MQTLGQPVSTVLAAPATTMSVPVQPVVQAVGPMSARTVTTVAAPAQVQTLGSVTPRAMGSMLAQPMGTLAGFPPSVSMSQQPASVMVAEPIMLNAPTTGGQDTVLLQ